MHELSVTESILEIALRHATQVEAKKINNLYIIIGNLASIVDDSIQFYWDLISQGTIAENAILHFERIPTKMECLDCKNIYFPEQGELLCPICHGINIKIIQGEEFYLSAIDVEK
jgi:hydrogenase nickel incorporation protein HypA/HybF